MAKREGNNGNHGAKGRSGRKPKALTLLKQRIESEKKDDAEFAFTLYASVMRDVNSEIGLRLDCAKEIMNRVLGKPSEKIKLSGWQDEIVSLLRDGKITAEDVEKELGNDAHAIIVAAGAGRTGGDSLETQSGATKPETPTS